MKQNLNKTTETTLKLFKRFSIVSNSLAYLIVQMSAQMKQEAQLVAAIADRTVNDVEYSYRTKLFYFSFRPISVVQPD